MTSTTGLAQPVQASHPGQAAVCAVVPACDDAVDSRRDGLFLVGVETQVTSGAPTHKGVKVKDILVFLLAPSNLIRVRASRFPDSEDEMPCNVLLRNQRSCLRIRRVSGLMQRTWCLHCLHKAWEKKETVSKEQRSPKLKNRGK